MHLWLLCLHQLVLILLMLSLQIMRYWRFPLQATSPLIASAARLSARWMLNFSGAAHGSIQTLLASIPKRPLMQLLPFMPQ